MGSFENRDNGTRMAVFDVDWTLLYGTSAETLFIHFLQKNGLLRLSHLLETVGYAVTHLPNGLIESILKNKRYLKGMDAADLADRMDVFYYDWLRPKLANNLLEEMEKLRRMGYELVLLSGTLDLIINTLCRHLRIQHGIGARLEMRNGRYTGRIVGIYPVHHRKVLVLERHFAGRPIDWLDSFAYGDSIWDLPLLSRVGHPRVVHPDYRLHQEALRRKWPVEHRRVPIQNRWQRFWIERFFRRINES